MDLDGRAVETAWDIYSFSTGVKSLVDNIKSGNVVGAIVDGVGVLADGAAIVLPGVPGGAGAGIKAIRALDKTVDAIKAVDKVADTADAAKMGKGLKIEISLENKVDRSLLNPPSKPGNAPTFKKDNKPVEIHHEGQKAEGPFKEMHRQDHRGKGNDKTNHPNKNSGSQIDRREFNKAKHEYWKKEYGNGK